MKQIYDAITGRILRTVVCSDTQYQYQVKTGESMVAGEGGNATHYVLEGTITSKIVNTASIDKTDILANGEDKAIISSLFNPSVVLIQGQEEIIIDGQVEITLDSKRSISAICRAVPYLDKEFIINAS